MGRLMNIYDDYLFTGMLGASVLGGGYSTPRREYYKQPPARGVAKRRAKRKASRTARKRNRE